MTCSFGLSAEGSFVSMRFRSVVRGVMQCKLRSDTEPRPMELELLNSCIAWISSYIRVWLQDILVDRDGGSQSSNKSSCSESSCAS